MDLITIKPNTKKEILVWVNEYFRLYSLYDFRVKHYETYGETEIGGAKAWFSKIDEMKGYIKLTEDILKSMNKINSQFLKGCFIDRKTIDEMNCSVSNYYLKRNKAIKEFISYLWNK